MSQRSLTACSRPSDAKSRILPLLLLLFLGSGCAALIYEIVWFQLLELIIGSSAISLGVLLGTFMGGMCLGSLLFPRLVSPRRHPLLAYAALELAIGLFAITLHFVLPYLDEAYAAAAPTGWAGLSLRAAVAAICLLPPTILMGATLPAIARWVEATPQGIAWLGFFYAGNIAGACLGCLTAGFYLLRVYDMATATYVAATINALAALAAFLLSRALPFPNSEFQIQNSETSPTSHSAFRILHSAFPIYLAIALSGAAALGAEVVWTRLLSLLLGGTVYTFSIILAVFLIGLGLGSTIGSFAARGTNPRLALAACQLLLTAAIWWAAYTLTQSLPYWPIDLSLSKNIWHTFQLDLVRCLWAILPAASLWGASFPLALASTNPLPRGEGGPAPAGPGEGPPDPAYLVSTIYAANTLGAILGAISFSTLIIAHFGTRHAEQILIGLSTLAALLPLCSLRPLWLSPPPGGCGSCSEPRLSIILAVVALAAGLFLAHKVPPTPGELIAHGRRLPSRTGQYTILQTAEGQNASIAVTTLGNGARNFHVSGKIEASSEPQDMRLQRMLGHIPALIHPAPQSVLVVGCGAGVTAGSFLCHPSVKRIVICEIEPLIPQVVAGYFSHENYNVVGDKRVEIVYDDGRHYVLTTREKFDVITSDPIHPWVKGAATLYTREYFEHCKQKLNKGGVITQWVPLYESNIAAVKSEMATFFEVFPAGTVWSNDQEGLGYDTVLLGQVGPLMIDVDDLEARLLRKDHAPVYVSLREVFFNSAIDLLATYAGAASDLKPWLADAQINRDQNLRLQYLAGTDSNTYHEAQIYSEIRSHRTFSDKIFTGSPENLAELKRKLNATSSDGEPSAPR